jgi:hypothetical protein
MFMKMKDRHFLGYTRSGKYDPTGKVLPGCYLEAERRDLNAKWGKIPDEDFWALQKAMYANAKKKTRAGVILTMQLSHGDVIVMHGADMQKYYEVRRATALSNFVLTSLQHMVICGDKMRFALTCRYIESRTAHGDENRKGVFNPSVGVAYNGDDTIPTTTSSTGLAVQTGPSTIDDGISGNSIIQVDTITNTDPNPDMLNDSALGALT